jgi:Kef-type K+ transport system membrane component KefB
LWCFCGLILLAALAGKLAGCSAAAWLGGFSRRESACIGVMMNTRGLMELIAVNLGYELKVIPSSVYCMLVIMALVTTVMATPTLMWLMRGTELEPYIRQSSFVGAEPSEKDFALSSSEKI